MHLVAAVRLITLLTDLLGTDLTVPVVAAVQVVVEMTELFTSRTGFQVAGELCRSLAALALGTPHPLLGLLFGGLSRLHGGPVNLG